METNDCDEDVDVTTGEDGVDVNYMDSDRNMFSLTILGDTFHWASLINGKSRTGKGIVEHDDD